MRAASRPLAVRLSLEDEQQFASVAQMCRMKLTSFGRRVESQEAGILQFAEAVKPKIGQFTWALTDLPGNG